MQDNFGKSGPQFEEIFLSAMIWQTEVPLNRICILSTAEIAYIMATTSDASYIYCDFAKDKRLHVTLC